MIFVLSARVDKTRLLTLSVLNTCVCLWGSVGVKTLRNGIKSSLNKLYARAETAVKGAYDKYAHKTGSMVGGWGAVVQTSTPA